MPLSSARLKLFIVDWWVSGTDEKYPEGQRLLDPPRVEAKAKRRLDVAGRISYRATQSDLSLNPKSYLPVCGFRGAGGYLNEVGLRHFAAI